jgi:tetrahydromethanopterin S-methyltransferase subunit D
VVGIPLSILMQGVQMAMFKNMGIDVPADSFGSGVIGAIIGGIVGAVVLAIFATIGGLIGSQVYKPTGGPSVPPAPGAPGAPYGQGF